MNKEIDIFIKYLKSKNLKLTDQRTKILNYFLKIDKHITVEDLYDIIKKKDSSIGHATVFRTLKLLCKAGIAGKVEFEDRRIRYEHKYGHQHHDHLICSECGMFFEVLDHNIERLQGKLCKKFDFLPNKHSMKFFGVCKKCQK